MVAGVVTDKQLKDISNAFREVTGVSKSYAVTEYAKTIRSLKKYDKTFTKNGVYDPSDEGIYAYGNVTVAVPGGGGSTLGSKNISSNGTYFATDDGYDGYDKVVVTVPGENYNSIEKDIFENGDYFASSFGADGFSKVSVNVATNVSPKIITENGIYNANNFGVDGFNYVNVNVCPPLKDITATSNGIYQVPSGYYGINSVNVQVPSSGNCNLIEKSISENGDYFASSFNADGFSKVSVNVPMPDYKFGDKVITENGTYNSFLDAFDGYRNVIVNVPTGGNYNSIEKDITENGDYFASSFGVDGFSKVSVNVPQIYNGNYSREVVINNGGNYEQFKEPYISYAISNQNQAFRQTFNSPVVIGNEISSLSYCFYDLDAFNQDVNIPDSVYNCRGIFEGCNFFNGFVNIGNNVEDLSKAFGGCLNYNRETIIPESVINIQYAFSGCTKFGSNIYIKTNYNSIDLMSSVGFCNGMLNGRKSTSPMVNVICDYIYSVVDYLDDSTMAFKNSSTPLVYNNYSSNLCWYSSEYNTYFYSANNDPTVYIVRENANFRKSTTFNKDVFITNTVVNCPNMFEGCSNFGKNVYIGTNVKNCMYMFSNNSNFYSTTSYATGEPLGLHIPDNVTNCYGMFMNTNLSRKHIFMHHIGNAGIDCNRMFELNTQVFTSRQRYNVYIYDEDFYNYFTSSQISLVNKAITWLSYTDTANNMTWKYNTLYNIWTTHLEGE